MGDFRSRGPGSAHGAPRRVLVQLPRATAPLIEVLLPNGGEFIAAPTGARPAAQFDRQLSFPAPLKHTSEGCSDSGEKDAGPATRSRSGGQAGKSSAASASGVAA